MGKQKVDKNIIREIYSRLIGIESYLNKEHPNNVRKELADNYTKLLSSLTKVSKESMDDFQVPNKAFYYDTNRYCYLDLFLPKVIELKHFLEARFPFVKHEQLPFEVKLYLSARSGIIDFLKSKLNK